VVNDPMLVVFFAQNPRIFQVRVGGEGRGEEGVDGNNDSGELPAAFYCA